MHPKVKKALEEIDAAVFSGDTFEEPLARKEAEHYLDRWRRALQHDDSIVKEDERRMEEPLDYGRAQPTQGDADFVRHFIEGEFARDDVERYKRSQVARKLGLVVAHYFNHGFDCGVEKVRSENGYQQGFRDAKTQAAAAIGVIEEPGSRERGTDAMRRAETEPAEAKVRKS